MRTRGLCPARQFVDRSELITQLPARIIVCACAFSQLVTQTSGDRACTLFCIAATVFKQLATELTSHMQLSCLMTYCHVSTVQESLTIDVRTVKVQTVFKAINKARAVHHVYVS